MILACIGGNIMQTLDSAVELVARLLHRVRNREISEDERRLLRRDSRAASAQGEGQRLQAIFTEAMTGFMEAASVGEALVDPNGIKERYGRTLRQNYPEAGPAFLQLATTYWTLKLFVDELRNEDLGLAAPNMLAEIERVVGSLFFPVPGPAKVDPATRERSQRTFLKKVAPQIDAEDMIQHNPILIRDRRSQGRAGCLSVLVALALGGAAVASSLAISIIT